MTKLLLRAILVFEFLLLGVGIFLYFSEITDNPVWQASHLHPLGRQHPYIITKSDLSYGEGAVLYAIIKPNEATNASAAAALSWRRIGKSEVDIEKYIGKEVYIDGYYYMGFPLLLEPIPESAKRTGQVTSEQPVIKITKIIETE